MLHWLALHGAELAATLPIGTKVLCFKFWIIYCILLTMHLGIATADLSILASHGVIYIH